MHGQPSVEDEDTPDESSAMQLIRIRRKDPAQDDSMSSTYYVPEGGIRLTTNRQNIGWSNRSKESSLLQRISLEEESEMTRLRRRQYGSSQFFIDQRTVSLNTNRFLQSHSKKGSLQDMG
jgi:hypothetical protein